MGRSFDIRDRILRLDPVEDHAQIYYLFVGFEFPWDVQRALELAMARTFCVPSISALLHRTGEFRVRGQKRYDDTGLLIGELALHGYDTARGQAVIDRINRIHARYAIANDDLKYVLSTFVFEPLRWIDRFGWRRTTTNERQASFHFYRQVGLRMGLYDVPEDYAAFERFNRDYEAARFEFAKSNREVADATRALFLSWFPFAVRPFVGAALAAVMDDPMLRAFGLARPLPGVRACMHGALRWRGRVDRLRPTPALPMFTTHAPVRSYPSGYSLEQLGPPEFVRQEREAQLAQADALRRAMRARRADEPRHASASGASP